MNLDEAKNILKENENVYLVLAGVDHSDGKFVRYAEEIGIKDNFRYLGWRSDVANLYAMADICTPTSIREGLGLNLVEAMKSGLPVVATDNRGHRTIIEDGVNGFLVPLNDEELYTKKIKELINNKELCEKFVENGNITTEKYSADAVVGKIEEILKEHL
jgi:glycosyltransferase EpsD